MLSQADREQFKIDFVSEVEDLLATLNRDLLKLEKDSSNQTLLDDLMRAAHSIKGDAALMQYPKMAFLAHVMEDVFDYARHKLITISPAMVDVIFQAIDLIEKSLNQIKKTDKELDVNEISQQLKEQTGVQTTGTGKSSRDISGQPVNKQAAAKPAKPTKQKKAAAPAPTKQPAPTTAGVAARSLSHVKVSVERLDALMGLMEELLISKMKLQTTIEQWQHKKEQLKPANSGQIDYLIEQLQPIANQLSRLTADMQYQIMKARLVPVNQIFSRFPRMVRDLANRQKKDVDFKVDSGDIKLDRSLIDKLAEPLLHLLRNAVDHGVDKQGSVRLQAARQKENSVISVENDGAPINWQLVLQAAIKRNIINASQEEKFSQQLKSSSQQPAGIASLIFHPRLSTKKEVTETSGRGVGLSVVQSFAEEHSGRALVQSPIKNGQGTRFTIILPSTVAIIDALLIEVAGSIFAIPFNNINQTVRLPMAEIKRIADQPVAIINKQDIPLFNLEQILNLDRPTSNNQPAVKTSPKKTLVDEQTIVITKKEQIGLTVDSLLGEQQIIVKPFSSDLRSIKGFSGSTILGNGQTILIIDIDSLLQLANSQMDSETK